MSQTGGSCRQATAASSDGSYENHMFQLSATDGTPVVRRPKAVVGPEARAFSASKKYEDIFYD